LFSLFILKQIFLGTTKFGGNKDFVGHCSRIPRRGYGPAPKCDKKDDPQVWVIPFPHLVTFINERKTINSKALLTYKYKILIIIGQKLTNYKNLALNKTKNKPKVHQGLASVVHIVVAVENTANPWYQLIPISRSKTKPDMCKLWYLCGVLCDRQSTVCWPVAK